MGEIYSRGLYVLLEQTKNNNFNKMQRGGGRTVYGYNNNMY